ncbi:MAG: hypothetical protein ICV60_05710 [Pyrinomonadaceae bacterium]|nr:hypothetical protein [Pyrinomonadaceae bacterium]
MRLALLLAVSPADIKQLAETIALYLTALSVVLTVITSAVVSGATGLLRFLHLTVPILEKFYPREGAGEWRPKVWGFLDKATWAIQRVSGAGHLPRQTTVHEVRRRLAAEFKETKLT